MCRYMAALHMNCFTAEEVQSAREYKYSGKSDSILLKLCYTRWWNWLITFIPLWVAPNLITFVGFLLEILSFVVSFVLSDGLKKPIPWWACALNGVCLFVYQTLDNLDGRQARRTQSSSALGQFFDHGCDAITAVSELVKVVATFGLGATKSFWFVFLMGIGFFLASWEEYATHAFYLGYVNGPDEGVTMFWVGHLVVAACPRARALAHLPATALVAIASFVGTVLGTGFRVARLAAHDRAVAWRATAALVPGAVLAALALLHVRARPEAVEDPFFVMASAFALQYLAQMTIVAFLTKRGPRSLCHWTLVVLWALEAAALAVPALAEHPRFWQGTCGLILVCMVVFDVRVVVSFCGGLGIHAFSLVRVPRKSQ